MTFERAWVLIFALAPLLWIRWEWDRTLRHTALVLKTLAFLAIILALSGPVMTVVEQKIALAVLVDTSRSVSEAGLEQATRLVREMESRRGRNQVRVIPFARVARPLSQEEASKGGRLGFTAGDNGRGTNLEAALRDAAAAMPAGLVPRIALVSDGNENTGSVLRAAWQVRQFGIPVDTFPVAGRAQPNLHLEGVVLPSRVFAGERFPIELKLSSPKPAEATVELTADGQVIGSRRIALEPGMNQFRVQASIATTGALDLAGRVHAGGLGEARFEQAVTMRKPLAAVISLDPVEGERHLIETLHRNQFEVKEFSQVPERLDDYQLVIFNNWDAEAIPVPVKQNVENYVRQGGGVLWIGGDRNVYVEKKEEDAFDRLLPAKLSPPRTPEGTCVVMIVDKSSSMEGKKMELARLAAIGVVDNLRPVDLLGVLIFDNSFQWVVPIRRAQDRPLLKRLIAGITPDGGTQIAPALAEAYHKISPVNAVYKHVVLLTDGISEEGDSIALSREAAEKNVTISTVGLGQDVNRAYLEKIASFSRGKSYFLSDPSGLEQILIKDVMEHTGSTAIERASKAKVEKQVEILSGTGIEEAPALRGYVKFIAKPTAETILSIDGRDPLLVRWQYGLGRAAVFTSDAKSRWAAQWVDWKGFDTFFVNLFRDLLPHSEAAEATTDYDPANDELTVDYRLLPGVDEPKSPPEIYAFGPSEFRRPVNVFKAADRHYRARFSLDGRQGLFRVRPVVETRAFPEVGFYRQESEMSEYGTNTALLKQIASSTGGRFQPKPADVFQTGGRGIEARLPLWPGLIGLAILLNLAELILRKGKGVMDFFRREKADMAKAA
jgi:Mg-chelatase subunit ChlD